MRNGEAIGMRRLIDDASRRGGGSVRGAAIFGTPGTTLAVMVAENPALDGRRRIARVRARAAASGLPPVVLLVVGVAEVSVYPATTQGEIMAPPVARWRAGEYRAVTRRHLLMLLLVVATPDGQRFELETKTFPVGPNRFNTHVARMIVQMGEGLK